MIGCISPVRLKPRWDVKFILIVTMGASLRPKGGAFPRPVRVGATAALGVTGLSGNLELGPGERWLFARVLAHQENQAQLNLHQLGFRSFRSRPSMWYNFRV